MNRAVLLDLDGTLLDTPSAIVSTIGTVLADLGHPRPAPAVVRGTVGRPLAEAFRTLAGPLDDDEVADATQRYLLRFRESVLPHARELVYPHVLDGLRELRGAGFGLAVATSKFTASARALLDAAGLLDLFDVVVGADEVSRPKPHPEMGVTVLRRMAVVAADAVMVGDTVHDIAMARAAGMASIAVTYGVGDRPALSISGPTRVADTFDEVTRGVTRIWEVVS
ncbi:MAG: HAD family hydrolase [Pseudonocardia sp.]|nr:HAD family hydrolase [Pseudonocardia sp.]